MRGVLAALLATLLVLAGCGKKTEITQPNTAAPYLTASGANVLPVTVGGTTLCGQSGYINELCTAVTICVPGTTQCSTITDILVDTGSVGLRLFSTAVPLTLPHITRASGQTLAECAQFGTGSDWGPLVSADVVLGGEPAIEVPVQLIDKNFARVSGSCVAADVDPQHAGYNGILGVGVFSHDCGQTCTNVANNGMYFSCDAAGDCAGTKAPLDSQLPNLVRQLPGDNNGLILALPPIDPAGAGTTNGVLVLGIGTQANNAPIGVSPMLLDGTGNFSTTLGGRTYENAFVDSGSNGLFFPNSQNIALCSGRATNASGPAANTRFYCPEVPQSLSARTSSARGGKPLEVSFQIGNATQLFSSYHFAYNNIGGAAADGFDWGLPFFFGRAVFFGLENTRSSLGEGPLLGY